MMEFLIFLVLVFISIGIGNVSASINDLRDAVERRGRGH